MQSGAQEMQGVCPRNLPKIRMSEFKVGQHIVWCTLVVRKMTKKIKPEIKLQ
jgi:hypothetical protein